MPAIEDVAPYLEFALPFYETRDSAHDAAHIQRIVRRLPELSQGVEPPPRQPVLHFLACFHGLGNRIAEDQEFDQRVRCLLVDLGWTEPEIDEAHLLLERHCVDPQTSEEGIVHDANYIEVLGAFGVAKAFTKGGAERQSYEETMAIFERNLHRVDFRTPHGRAVADEGRSFAESFLKRLSREL